MPEQPDKPPVGGRGGPPPVRFGRNMMVWVVIIALTVMLATFMLQEGRKFEEVSITDFWAYLRNGQIKELQVKGYDDRVEGRLTPGINGRDRSAPDNFFVSVDFQRDPSFIERMDEALAKLNDQTVRLPDAPKPGLFMQILPYIVIYGGLFLLVWFLLFRRIGQAGGGAGFLGNFGRSRHRLTTKEHVTVTFADVAGIEEAKDEVKEIIEFLKSPRRFQRLGGRVPRGVLLVGEPGCGKTLLAKAIAGEAEVPFFSISGSDFVEMFVGVGASRVRDLFRSAKESSPCIIFLDEIDAVGRRRGAGFNGGGHDEREQTLNAILVEMDGFDSNVQVIVIAATNRMDVLDPALTRPGRFDRQVHVPLPDLNGRFDILKIYAEKVKCGPDVDLHRLARGTPMFSGADLAALINEAAIAATMADKDYVEQTDMEEARDKVRWGRARKSRVIDEKEKDITAYHEAGHALVQVLLPDTDPLHKVSIIPRGPMGGATFSLPEKDRYLYTRKYCRALISVTFGGRLAEEIFCGDVSSGASNDIAQATEIARKMVLDWGMSDKLGLVNYAGDERRQMFDLSGKEYSEQTAEVIDAEVRAIIDECRRTARDLIEAHRDKLERLAKALLIYETLSANEVQAIFDGKTLDKPTVDDLLEAEKAKAPRPAEAGVILSPPVPRRQSPPLPEPG